MVRSTGFVAILIVYFLYALQAKADLLPIVEPGSTCSGNGLYDPSLGLCVCKWPSSGRICQYERKPKDCVPRYDCYSCEDYMCPYSDYGGFRTQIWTCTSTATIKSFESDSETEASVTLHNTCRNVTSFCYTECDCPSGLAFLASSCFKEDLLHSFGFFLLIMAALTVFSTVFEFGTHILEHRLEHHNHRALLGFLQTLKSELTLIGLISLTLYLASSSSVFEHGVEALGGKEEVIEAIHFLIFFIVLGYFFTLAICLVFSKIILARRLRKYEEIFQDARKAALRGENYEEVKQELMVQNKLTGFFSKTSFREYNAYRIYFMRTMKNSYSEEELMFFRFDQYLMLCINDLIGRISGGTWFAWIYFAFNFFVNVYLTNSWIGYVRHFLIAAAITIAGMADDGVRDGIFRRLDAQDKEQPNQDEAISEELLPIVSAEHPNERGTEMSQSKSRTSPVILFNQSMLWYVLTFIFSATVTIALEWYWILLGLVIVFVVYAFQILYSLPKIAGAIYNGSLVNKQFIKEVLTRHPQVDQHILIDQYRNKNNGELPVIKDAVVSLSAP